MGRERDFFAAVVVSGLALTGCSSETTPDASTGADVAQVDAPAADDAGPDVQIVADATAADVSTTDVSTEDAEADTFVAIL